MSTSSTRTRRAGPGRPARRGAAVPAAVARTASPTSCRRSPSSSSATSTSGWCRVQAISNWVHEHLGFDYGAASPMTTAVDVLRDGHGVCRDFTHLAIALCRALNVPSRYVFGYLPDIAVPDPGTPMDFCAWMEVWLGDRWYTFDPRNDQHRIGRTVIGRGRDAADVAMVTTFGPIDARLDDRRRRGGALTWRSRSCSTTASSCSTTAASTSPRPARRPTCSATRSPTSTRRRSASLQPPVRRPAPPPPRRPATDRAPHPRRRPRPRPPCAAAYDRFGNPVVDVHAAEVPGALLVRRARRAAPLPRTPTSIDRGAPSTTAPTALTTARLGAADRRPAARSTDGRRPDQLAIGELVRATMTYELGVDRRPHDRRRGVVAAARACARTWPT